MRLENNYEKNVYIVVCDGAWPRMEKENANVSLLIGDFDSLKGPVPTDVPALRFPKDKDDTDSMLAVKYAIEHGFEEIVMRGALGGRLDHEFANLQAGAYAAQFVKKCTIIDDNNEVVFIYNAEMRFPKKENFSLSVFSMSDISEGVTIRGAKYEIENENLTNTFPRGISNEWASDEAVISVKNGTLMIIQSKLI